MKTGFFVILLFWNFSMNILAQTTERAVTAEAVVSASLDEVWQAWTTEEGVKSFFAPACKVELEIFGAYEMFFNPMAEEGNRGGEGNKILAIQPKKMLSFTWNAPPSLPTVRNQRTIVIVRFVTIENGKTKITLHHSGWGVGGEWDKAFDYFNNAWNRFVMPMLKYRFEHGPVDWNNLPKLDSTN